MQLKGFMLGTVVPQSQLSLHKKIRRWEFVDMGELLPEFSQSEDEAAA